MKREAIRSIANIHIMTTHKCETRLILILQAQLRIALICRHFIKTYTISPTRCSSSMRIFNLDIFACSFTRYGCAATLGKERFSRQSVIKLTATITFMVPRPHECIRPCAIFYVNHAAPTTVMVLLAAISSRSPRNRRGQRLFQLKKHRRYPVTENGLASVFPIASLRATRLSSRFNVCLTSTTPVAHAAARKRHCQSKFVPPSSSGRVIHGDLWSPRTVRVSDLASTTALSNKAINIA